MIQCKRFHHNNLRYSFFKNLESKESACGKNSEFFIWLC
jgi:hypothetical protein